MKGRPSQNEFNPYFSTYVDKVGPEGFLQALESQTFYQMINSLTETEWNHSYAEGKWTIKEVLVHIMDTERIFAYRALRISRGDKTALAGFEQDDYVPFYRPDERTIDSLLEEYKAVRAATITLYKSFSEADYKRLGVASGSDISVLALGYMIAGHEIHHFGLIQERYLV